MSALGDSRHNANGRHEGAFPGPQDTPISVVSVLASRRPIWARSGHLLVHPPPLRVSPAGRGNLGSQAWHPPVIARGGEGVDERFRALVEGLHPKFEQLVGMAPHAGVPPPTKMPVSSIYLFSDGDQPLYVGRSNRLRKRFFLHTREGSRHNQVSFAFRLVAEALKLPPASYTRKTAARSWHRPRSSFESSRLPRNAFAR